MRCTRLRIKGTDNEKGVALVLVVILIIVFLGVAALAIDTGYMMVVRNQCQNAADAAALAGARRVSENYYSHVDPATTNVVSRAQETAQANKVGGQELALGNIDVKIGTWGITEANPTPHFTETTDYPNAVQVNTNAAVNTFFAGIFGLINVNPGGTACAAILGPCEGKPTIPLGISKGWFDTHPGDEMCGPKIRLNDTNDSCAGWTNLSMDSKQIQKAVENMFKGTQPTPEITAGVSTQFIGGTITPILTAFKARFDREKLTDADGDPTTWTTYVVVYDAPCSRNPNQAYPILGFANVVIEDVIPTGSNKGVIAHVACHMTDDSRGGCFYAGTWGKYPSLVQ